MPSKLLQGGNAEWRRSVEMPTLPTRTRSHQANHPHPRPAAPSRPLQTFLSLKEPINPKNPHPNRLPPPRSKHGPLHDPTRKPKPSNHERHIPCPILLTTATTATSQPRNYSTLHLRRIRRPPAHRPIQRRRALHLPRPRLPTGLLAQIRRRPRHGFQP